MNSMFDEKKFQKARKHKYFSNIGVMGVIHPEINETISVTLNLLWYSVFATEQSFLQQDVSSCNLIIIELGFFVVK